MLVEEKDKEVKRLQSSKNNGQKPGKSGDLQKVNLDSYLTCH
jgi:hypothetical protein